MSDEVPLSDEVPRDGRAEALEAAIRGAREMVDLIQDSRVRRVRLRAGDIRLDIECDGGIGPAAPRAEGATPAGEPAGGQPAAAAPAQQESLVAVGAPLMGVFYRRPGPDQPPFVEVGQQVDAGQQVAIVEAMKTMNAVVAERSGTLREVHVDDGEVVEFEQPLMSLEPL